MESLDIFEITVYNCSKGEIEGFKETVLVGGRVSDNVGFVEAALLADGVVVGVELTGDSVGAEWFGEEDCVDGANLILGEESL